MVKLVKIQPVLSAIRHNSEVTLEQQLPDLPERDESALHTINLAQRAYQTSVQQQMCYLV